MKLTWSCLSLWGLLGTIATPAFAAPAPRPQIEALVCRYPSGEPESIRLEEGLPDGSASWLLRSLPKSRVRFYLVQKLIDTRVMDLVDLGNLETWNAGAEAVRRSFPRANTVHQFKGELPCYREPFARLQNEDGGEPLIVLNRDLVDRPEIQPLTLFVAIYTLDLAAGLRNAKSPEVQQNAVGVAQGLVRDLLEDQMLTPAEFIRRLQAFQLLKEKTNLNLPAFRILNYIDTIPSSRYGHFLRHFTKVDDQAAFEEAYKRRDEIFLHGFRQVLASLPYALKAEYQASPRSTVLEELAQKITKGYANFADTSKTWDNYRSDLDALTRLYFDLEAPLIY